MHPHSLHWLPVVLLPHAAAQLLVHPPDGRDIAAAAVGAELDHHGREEEHGPDDTPEDDKKDEGPVLEEDIELATEKQPRGRQRGDRTRENRDAHLPERVLHLLLPRVPGRHVERVGEVNHIIDRHAHSNLKEHALVVPQLAANGDKGDEKRSHHTHNGQGGAQRHPDVASGEDEDKEGDKHGNGDPGDHAVDERVHQNDPVSAVRDAKGLEAVLVLGVAEVPPLVILRLDDAELLLQVGDGEVSADKRKRDPLVVGLIDEEASVDIISPVKVGDPCPLGVLVAPRQGAALGAPRPEVRYKGLGGGGEGEPLGKAVSLEVGHEAHALGRLVGDALGDRRELADLVAGLYEVGLESG
mmetsp:Transcript_28014/g.70910  ORF Transcript_28014/g.70910 Transcript_28014/m.70910 type:complete len:356 (+) Transcript_28014:371-1438(+)